MRNLEPLLQSANSSLVAKYSPGSLQQVNYSRLTGKPEIGQCVIDAGSISE